MAEPTNKPTGTQADFDALTERVQKLSDVVAHLSGSMTDRVMTLESKVANLEATAVEQNTKINDHESRIAFVEAVIEDTPSSKDEEPKDDGA